MNDSTKRFRPKAIFWRIGRLILAAYLTVVLGMSMIERWLVYPAPPLTSGNWDTPEDASEAWIDIPAAEGVAPTRVHGWLFEHDEPDHVLLYCHGNGEHVADLTRTAQRLRDTLAATVLVWDYRGYGKSAGTPHERALIADGLAAQRWLAERAGVGPSEVVVMGRSLGGGVATALAAEQGAAALVLQSTFTRITDAAAEHYPWLPVRWIMVNRFDSLARLAQYEGPVAVTHGDADRVISFGQGERLVEAATGPTFWMPLPGTDHFTLPPAEYYVKLAAFLTEHANGRPMQEEPVDP